MCPTLESVRMRGGESESILAKSSGAPPLNDDPIRSATGPIFRRAFAVMLSIGVVSIWVLASYLRVDPFNLLTYIGDDHWCDTATEGVGIHCFGDFNEFLEPGKDALTLTPLSAPIFSVLNAAIFHVSARSILFMYIAVMFAMILVTPLILARRSNRSELLPDLFIYTLLTLPAIALLDRGNLLVLAVPALTAAVLGFVTPSRKLTVVGIAVASVIKPQFLILAFIPLVRRQYRTAAIAVVTAITAIALTFLPYGNPITRLYEWIESLGAYSASSSHPDWRNYSWPSLLEKLARIGGLDSLATWIHARLTLMGLLVLIIGLAVAFFRRDRISSLDLSLAVTLLGTFWVGTVYGYYLAVLLPFVWLFLGYPAALQSEVNTSVFGRKPLLVAVIALVVAPVILPTHPLHPSGGNEVINIMPSVSSLLLLCLTAYVLLVSQPTTSASVTPSDISGR